MKLEMLRCVHVQLIYQGIQSADLGVRLINLLTSLLHRRGKIWNGGHVRMCGMIKLAIGPNLLWLEELASAASLKIIMDAVAFNVKNAKSAFVCITIKTASRSYMSNNNGKGRNTCSKSYMHVAGSFGC